MMCTIVPPAECSGNTTEAGGGFDRVHSVQGIRHMHKDALCFFKVLYYIPAL
jgi:hypothetical protein